MMDRDPPGFGDLLRQRRRDAGLTQEALAERAGISARTIIDLERGVIRAPRRDTLELLATALDLSSDEHQQWREIRLRSSTRSAPRDAARQRGTSLPQPPNPLLGRDSELSSVTDLLANDPDVRLLTVSGPAGIGKTRLALEAAHSLEQHFQDGAIFVDLAQVQSAGLVLPTIAKRLDLAAAGGQPVEEQLRAYLAHRAMLLVIDNFEHVLTAAPDLADLMAASPGIKLLVTSRSRLQLRGEQEFPLSPLRLPDRADGLELDDIERFPAVQLFVQRCQQVQPGFRLTANNLDVVVAICARLDGLPLAIELAAARIHVLPPREMLTRLEDQLGLLTSGFQDLPDRHQTMHNAIEWSYQFLSLNQKTLFRQLSIFVDGCSLEAVRAISMSPDNALDDLASLVDSSLMTRTELPDGGYRFGMLEPIRAFAQRRLVELSEMEKTRRAHAEYYLGLVEEAESGLRSPAQSYWLDVLALELGNIRLAAEWCRRPDVEPDLGLRLSGALNVGISHVVPVEVETELGLRLSQTPGRSSDGENGILREEHRFSPETARQAKDPRVRQKALAGSGWLAGTHGEFAAARTLLEESLAIARELDDRQAIAWTLHLLGRSAEFQSDTSLAPDYYARSIATAQEIGDDWIIAWSHHRLGFFHHAFLGDLDSARQHYEISLEIRERIGYQEGISVIWSLMGIIERQRGEFRRALQLLQQALRILGDLRARWLSVIVIANCVQLATSSGEPERAARLGSFCATTMELLNRQSLPLSDEAFQQGLEAARAQLDEDTYNRAREEGRQLSLRQAVDEALCLGGSEREQSLDAPVSGR